MDWCQIFQNTPLFFLGKNYKDLGASKDLAKFAKILTLEYLELYTYTHFFLK
jgi:hypothetical protein